MIDEDIEYEFSGADIEQALKKLMSQIYYDKSNTNLHLRAQLTQKLTEIGFEKICNQVRKLIKSKRSWNQFLEDPKNEIEYKVIPKSAKSDEFESSTEYLSNNRTADAYRIMDVNLIIDAPIEIHVLSVLWLMKFGVHLDSILSETCYGNRLLLDDEADDKPKIKSGRALLKPYIHQYQKWRDEGIRKAKDQLDEDNNTAFINLDISSYYYHVRVNWDVLEKELKIKKKTSKELLHLNSIIRETHQNYTNLIKRHYPQKCGIENDEKWKENEVILPLGLVSSYTLGNYYLKSFDDFIEKNVGPEYYGRYVDDIIIVLNKPRLNADFKERPNDADLENHELINATNLPPSLRFIINNLSELFKVYETESENSQAEKNSGDNSTRDFRFYLRENIQRNYDKLYIQNSKVLVYEFKAGQSQSVIAKLIKDIKERSSEFRFLPTDEDADFDSDAFELLYDDSFGKPRTLKDYKESKLGLATYLYRRSSVALWADQNELRDESHKILAFFNGINLINFYQYWERVFTYLVIANRKQEIIKLIESCFIEIEKITYKDEKSENIKETLKDYLSISLAQALSLNPRIFCDEWFAKRLNSITNKGWKDLTGEHIVHLRRTGFIRNYYIIHPLIEFTDWARQTRAEPENKLSSLPSLLSKNFQWQEISSNDLSISFEACEIPRFVRFFECCVFTWFESVANDYWIDDAGEGHFDFLTSAKERFNDLNYSAHEKKVGDELFEQFPDPVIDSSNNPANSITEIRVDQYKSINYFEQVDANNKITLGLANIQVHWSSEAIRSLQARPVLSRKRYDRITSYLNKFVSETPEPEIGILPECSIPYDFLSLMTHFSKRHQKGLVFGTEHVNNGKKAYNFIMTCLPVKLKNRQDAVLVPRLKNHYSPQEEQYIKGYDLLVAKYPLANYHLFKWRNLYFTSFYCFELADIVHRSWFRSKIDIMMASELNRDTNYFSSIVDSTTRDLNTVVAQVNSSQFGDNRITQPARTYHKNLCRIDGGDNDLVIVCEIDIKKLREHQEKGHELQIGDPVYKPSPPDFEVENVRKRIRGEWILKVK